MHDELVTHPWLIVIGRSWYLKENVIKISLVLLFHTQYRNGTRYHGMIQNLIRQRLRNWVKVKINGHLVLDKNALDA